MVSPLHSALAELGVSGVGIDEDACDGGTSVDVAGRGSDDVAVVQAVNATHHNRQALYKTARWFINISASLPNSYADFLESILSFRWGQI